MKYKSPVYGVIAVPLEKIAPNTYNPNTVAPPEFALLYESIREDGYTMPVVCYYDKDADKYSSRNMAPIRGRYCVPGQNGTQA